MGLGPTMADERLIALEMLELAPGERVLDIGCGPGNFTRAFARAAEDGLVVGIDASETMLARAVTEPMAANMAISAAMPPTCRFEIAPSTLSAASRPCTWSKSPRERSTSSRASWLRGAGWRCCPAATGGRCPPR